MSRNFSLIDYWARRYADRPRNLTFCANDKAAASSWQAEFKPKLVDMLGGWIEQVPLNPEITDKSQEDGYVRYRLVYDSEPDMSVPCWLLVPDGIAPGEKRPAVMALHGHGRGRDDVAGVDGGDPERRKEIDDFNYDYARQFALRGYVVLAQDHRVFGERVAGLDRHIPRDPCNFAYIESMLWGLNPLTMNVWDAMKGIDYLETRDDVDITNIGACGLSYGGTITLFLSALDERIKAAVISGYLSPYRTFCLEEGHICGNQIVTGLLEHADLPDVACLIAPRPLLVEMGTLDTTFPIDGAREAYGHVCKAYGAFGADGRIELDEFEGGHRWSGEKAYPCFAQWLGGRSDV